MNQEQPSRWRAAIGRVAPPVRIVGGLALTLVFILLLVGYSQATGTTLWDWLKLLIVPAVIAGVGVWFNWAQKTRELNIARSRAQDEALQAYLDHMSQLLTDKAQPLQEAQWREHLSTVARARTLTVLPSLDSGRKRSVLQFLTEAGLIDKEDPALSLVGADLQGASLQRASLDATALGDTLLKGANLEGANLSGANLEGANLSGANLQGADLQQEANLQGAYLREAHLEGANLSGANLQRAHLEEADLKVFNLRATNLREADLQWANLYRANLQGAYLRGANLYSANLNSANLKGADLKGINYEFNLRATNLRGADLQEANLEGANLQRAQLEGAGLRGAYLKGADLQWADLKGADLQEANLSGAKVTPGTAEQLDTARSLNRTIMPDGSRRDYWRIKVARFLYPIGTILFTIGFLLGVYTFATITERVPMGWTYAPLANASLGYLAYYGSMAMNITGLALVLLSARWGVFHAWRRGKR